MEENKENEFGSKNTDYLAVNKADCKAGEVSEGGVYSFNDSTILGESLYESDDETFKDVERMCNKTLSDPNNTIHEYLARKSKKCWNQHEKPSAIETILDQSKLSDIEAPSCLWENTISGNTSPFENSPMKPVPFVQGELVTDSGEFEQREIETTSSDEYVTASEAQSVGNGSSYETPMLINFSQFENNVESSNLDGKAVASNSWNYTSLIKETTSLLSETFNISCSSNENASKSNKSYNLIHLDDTYQTQPKEVAAKIGETFIIPNNFNEADQKSMPKPLPVDKTIILISDDEEDENSAHNSHNTEYSFLAGESHDSIDDKQLSVSQEFNDTLEEIDYIMKHGMKYLAENPITPKLMQIVKTPSPTISSSQTPNTVIAKPKQITSQEKSQEIFKKPHSKTRIPQFKTLIPGKKPSDFEHIVSPVGAYIKNTPKTPTMTELKPTLDIFQSKAVRGLDYSPKCGSTSMKKTRPVKEMSLPKKAYISSELKHVVDQRKPVTIPGGDKIHRYLQLTKEPLVIRHEGKIKLDEIQHQRIEIEDALIESDVRPADSSLADLSTVSGDISLHVWKDARLKKV